MQFQCHILLIVVCYVIAPLVLASCNHSDNTPSSHVDILRVDKAIAVSDSTHINQQIFNLLQLNFPQLHIDSTNLSQSLYDIAATPIFEEFFLKVDSAYPDNYFLDRELKFLANAPMSSFSSSPNVVTYISPYNQSIILGDNYVAVALNHYLGASEPTYSYFPHYLRKFKDKSRIAIDVNEALVRHSLNSELSANYSPSLLQSMILNGIVIKMMQINNPQLSISQILMWDSDDLATAKKHEFDLWQYLIARDLLYSTSAAEINQFIELSPVVVPVGNKNLQWLGRFIGYNIVDKYLKSQNKKISLEVAKELLNTPPQQILINSNYNGR